MPTFRTPRLAVIGGLAGLFSGLFGVGGGTVMVPLLVLWLGVGERRATAISLGAIAVMASAAVAVHALYGNVRVAEALLVGVPALAGVLAGTALQQRLPQRAVSVGFALLLLVTAAAIVVRP